MRSQLFIILLCYIRKMKMKQTEYIIELFDVRYRDIDPDTGYTTTDAVMCVAFSKESAQSLASILHDTYQREEANPNREIYVKKREIIF